MSEAPDNEYREQRLANMRELEAMGYQPFGRAFIRSGSLAAILRDYEEDKAISAAGRLMTIRDMGKSIFADLRDGSGKFQIYIRKNIVGDDAFKAFKLLDAGDHIGAQGKLFTTRAGEATLQVQKWELLAKALLPLPEKWHGLKDVEARYRQRYLDLIANPGVRELFDKRTAALCEVRRYLAEKGFLEVETPMLQHQAGGAAAKPFVTHYAALGQDMYLRIAPELYLKRLLVGGFDKVFELNRSFRNEGLSRTHNPEFTILEIYEAYTDLSGMKDLVVGLITHIAQKIFGTLKVGEGQQQVDLTPPWREVAYRELIEDRMGADWYDLPRAEARARAEAKGLTVDPEWDGLLITHEVYEKLVERTLVQPTFVTRFPAALIPLARACEDDSSSADVFELVIRGQEIAPAYTELNDSLAQRERLANQAGTDREKIDEDFLTALEHGMPPAGGMGIGVDRMLVILSGSDTLRDVILFPQLRSKSQ